MFKRIDHVEIVTARQDETVAFYTDVLGFREKARDRVQRPDGTALNLVYLDLGGTVVELMAWEGVPVGPGAGEGASRLPHDRARSRRHERDDRVLEDQGRRHRLGSDGARHLRPRRDQRPERLPHRTAPVVLGAAGCRAPTGVPCCGSFNAIEGGNHGEIHAGQLQDLPLGAALGDHPAREEHAVRNAPYRARQPARLVPGDLAAQKGAGADRRRQDSLFESNAINEYLDETIAPRLHPADPVERARNRAWTDYVPTFASAVTGCAYAADRGGLQKGDRKGPEAFERLEKALEANGAGPFFNGAKYSLVDAAYAPFLQRYLFLDRIKKIGLIEKYPRVKAWADALMARPSTHSFPEAEFEAMYREGVRRRKSYVSQFVEAPRAAAE